MITAVLMTPLSPKIETETSLAGILHWTHPSGKQAHCLMRLTHHEQSPVVILSELMSNPAHLSFIGEVTPVAIAAFSTIKDRVKDPQDILWLTHAGDFSTPDTMFIPDGYNEYHRIHLRWDNGKCTCTTADYHRLRHDDPFPDSLGLETVPCILDKLEWTNWIEDTNE